MTQDNTHNQFGDRVKRASVLVTAIDRALKKEKNETLSAILDHCGTYVCSLVYEVSSNPDPNDPDVLKKLDKIEAASKILSAYHGDQNDEATDAAKFQRLGKLFEDPTFKADISKSRSSDFIEKIKQVFTLGLINLKRVVTGRSEGERTFNRIESEIKKSSLSALPNTSTNTPSSPQCK